MAAQYASPDGDLPWTVYLVRLDSMLESVKEYTPHVSAAVQREFPTFAEFDKRRFDVYRVIARGFLDDQAYATYELFLEFYDRKKPPVYAVEARRVCVPYQKRVMRTVRHLEGFYPDEVLRRKEQAAKDLEEELKTRSSDKAKKESQAEQVQQENAFLKSLLLANGIRPPPLIHEPEDASDSDIEDIKIEPLTLEDAPVGEALAIEDVQVLALEEESGPGTPILTPEEESDEESLGGDKIPAAEVCDPLIARFAQLAARKTKKPSLHQDHTVRRSVQASLETAGVKFVPVEGADAFVSVPSKGGRGLAFRELVACGKSFFLLVDVRFLCRAEFIAACSAEAAFKYQLEYVPKDSYLTTEAGDKIVFSASVWICHTASTKSKSKPAVFTSVAADELSIDSTKPDLYTRL